MSFGTTLAQDPASGPTMRIGLVTQASPLLVRVGAATTPAPASALGSYAPRVDDVVTLLEQGADRIVLGTVEAAPWTAAILASPWANYGGTWTGAGYRRVGDEVQVRGLIAGGTSGATIMVLPARHRPAGDLVFVTAVDVGGGNVFARIDVYVSGAVVAYFPAGTAAYLSINLSFSVS